MNAQHQALKLAIGRNATAAWQRSMRRRMGRHTTSCVQLADDCLGLKAKGPRLRNTRGCGADDIEAEQPSTNGLRVARILKLRRRALTRIVMPRSAHEIHLGSSLFKLAVSGMRDSGERMVTHPMHASQSSIPDPRSSLSFSTAVTAIELYPPKSDA